MKKYDILTVGYAGYDLAISGVPQNAMELDSTGVGGRIITVGGDGINAATSFARLGYKTAIATAVGDDELRDTVLKHLRANGISEEYVSVLIGAETTFTLLLIGENGERHCLIRQGCRPLIAPDMIPDDALNNARHLHYASFYPMVKLDPHAPELLRKAKEAGMTTSMDAVRYEGSDAFDYIFPALHYVDLFIPGIAEAEMIFATRDFQKMKKILKPTGMKYFGIKCGADGLYLTDFKKDYHIPTYCKGTPVDTTGAGDALVSGCAAAMVEGFDTEKIGRFGSANAAFAIESFGATTGLKPMEDVLKRAGIGACK